MTLTTAEDPRAIHNKRTEDKKVTLLVLMLFREMKRKNQYDSKSRIEARAYGAMMAYEQGHRRIAINVRISRNYTF